MNIKYAVRISHLRKVLGKYMSCSVIGIGKLGLCFALTLDKRGLKVIGVDINKTYVDEVNTRSLKSDEPNLMNYLKESKLEATTDLSMAVNSTKFVFILVQTPETDESYDHAILIDVIKKIKSVANEPKHIIVNSTVMPGFYRSQDVAPHTLSYNPAFVAQGAVLADYERNGKFGVSVIGTYEPEVEKFMKEIFPNIRVMTPESTEVFKIADNTFRVVKIAYANFIGDICHRTPGACSAEVSNSLKVDESVGSICMTPGYGYGGPCYPRDLKALTTYAKSRSVDASILEGVRDTNEDHHQILVNDLLAKNLDEYVFESVTYRPGMTVNLTDNSPVLRIIRDLEKLGRNVRVLAREG